MFCAVNITLNTEGIRQNILDRAIYIRQIISKELKNKFICLKIDNTIRHNRNVFGINVQFIKNFKIIIYTLAIIEIESSTSEYLQNVKLSTLEKYNFQPWQIFSITSDNGAIILKTVSLLKLIEIDYVSENDSEDNSICIDCELQIDKNEYNSDTKMYEEDDDAVKQTLDLASDNSNVMRNIEGGSSILTGMRCAAHTLQLSVLEVLKTRSICQILNKTRSITKHLRKPTMQTALKIFNVKKPNIDCITRWGSSHDMVNNFLKCQQFCEVIAL